MGQKITVRDNGTPVYLGESDFAGPEGRLSYLEYVMDKLNNGIAESHMVAEDCDDDAIRCEGCLDEAYHELSNAYTWYEDGVAAATMGVIGRELAHLADTVIVKFVGDAVGKALKKGASAYISARFKMYSTIYPEIIPLSEFKSVNFDILEAATRYNIKFKLAGKWAEKVNTRVTVRVYTKDRKPAFAIAYSDKSQDKTYNSEFVMINNRYRKHADYYTAAAHTDIGIMHPSIRRVLVEIRSEWKKMRDASKKSISESVEEAIAEDKYLEKRLNVVDAYKAGAITYEDADAYLEAMDLMGFDMDDDTIYEEVDKLL